MLRPLWATEQAPIDHIVALVRRQHGCATRAQLIALGLPARTVSNWLARRRLFAVYAGVYALGRPLSTPLERAAAAVPAVRAPERRATG